MNKNSKYLVLSFPGQPIFMFEEGFMSVDEQQYQLSQMSINFDQNKNGKNIKMCDKKYCIHIEGSWSLLEQLFETLKKYCFQTNIKTDYQITKMIGQGSFGKVYEGIHKTRKLKYAIKVLQKNAYSQSNSVLQLEIDILRRLNHEKCIHIHEQYLDDNYIYIVLDYIRGGDLLDYLDQQTELVDENTVRDLMRILFEALEYIHSKGIVHRDLKPENILMKNKSCIDLVITDFGLADLCLSGFLTQKCGTLGFIAPEILRGKPYDYKVDVFSLGVILYGILVGEYPFEGNDPEELQNNNYEANINFNLSQLKLISQQGMDFLKKCLSIYPKDRFSAKEAIIHPWLSQIDIDSRFMIDSFQKSNNLKSAQRIKSMIRIIESQTSIDQPFMIDQEDENETKPCQIMDQYVMRVHFYE